MPQRVERNEAYRAPDPDAVARRSVAPASGEEYAEYYGRYVARAPAGDVVTTLAAQMVETVDLLRAVPAERTTVGYAPGKWSIRDIVGHVSDAERVFSYRALRIARGDQTPLPGFDEGPYAAAAGANARSMDALLTELLAVRESTLELFSGLSAAAWDRRGTASGHPVSVRGLAWIIAGHELHHRAIVTERYL
jgi:hypothetical protein